MTSVSVVRATLAQEATTASFAFTVLSGRDAPATARHAMADNIEGWGADGRRFDLQLLLSELVTNAVKHGEASAASPVVVEGALIGRCLGIEVTNCGRRFEHVPDQPLEPPVDMGVDGRGLALVDALAARWGARHEAGLTTVWFELDAEDGL